MVSNSHRHGSRLGHLNLRLEVYDSHGLLGQNETPEPLQNGLSQASLPPSEPGLGGDEGSSVRKGIPGPSDRTQNCQVPPKLVFPQLLCRSNVVIFTLLSGSISVYFRNHVRAFSLEFWAPFPRGEHRSDATPPRRTRRLRLIGAEGQEQAQHSSPPAPGSSAPCRFPPTRWPHMASDGLDHPKIGTEGIEDDRGYRFLRDQVLKKNISIFSNCGLRVCRFGGSWFKRRSNEF